MATGRRPGPLDVGEKGGRPLAAGNLGPVFRDEGLAAEQKPTGAVFGAPRHPRPVDFRRGPRDH